MGLDRFYAIHVRRNDFQYTQTRLQASEIARNVGSLFDEKLPLYLATDDPGNELRDDLQDLLGVPKIVRLNDALDALQADVPFEWLGTLEKAICALATRFVGTDLSTFSGYIHRLRGYLNSGDPGCYYHSIKYANPDDGAHHPDVKKGQEYLRENPLMWQDC